MKNILTQGILTREVDSYSEINECPKHISFTRLLLEKIHDLDNIESEEAITDGSGDGGIDAIFEKEIDGQTLLFLVQSKFCLQNPDKSLDESAIKKMIFAIEHYILGEDSMTSLNERLKDKIKSSKELIKNGTYKKISMLFLTNCQPLESNNKALLEMFCNKQSGTIDYKVITQDDLFYVFALSSTYQVDKISLKIVKDTGHGDKAVLNLPDIDCIQGKVFKVDLVEIARIVSENPNIFNSNVRAFQTLKNKVNLQIAQSLKDSDEIREFVYLNNGITMICDDYEIKLGQENVEIENPSIINGCQTSTTIAEVYKEGCISQNTGFVLVRLLKTKDPNIKDKIIIASNTQTAILNRDLISEEKIQKQLEIHFQQFGYFYQRKSGLYLDKPKDKIVDPVRAAQCFLAFYIDKPAEAKNKRSEIFSRYYDQIFNDKINALKLLSGWLLYKNAESVVLTKRKETNNTETKSTLGNCLFHLLPLFKRWVLVEQYKSIDLSDYDKDIASIKELENLFQNHLNIVIERLLEIVENIKKNSDSYNPQYFFKTSDSLSKILSSDLQHE